MATQTMAAPTTVERIPVLDEATEAEMFTKTSQTGWDRFGKFLLMNVIAVIVTLLIIGALTVWS